MRVASFVAINRLYLSPLQELNWIIIKKKMKFWHQVSESPPIFKLSVSFEVDGREGGRAHTRHDWTLFVGDMKKPSCEPRGIPLKGLQIACVVTIYFDYVICKSA